MKKRTRSWSITKLQQEFIRIHFPEYQREPNLWSLTEKQRLIDSMVRQFDIASIYLYEHPDDMIDCVDGRQRLGAISSFLGDNRDDPHNEFQLRTLNEIYDDESSPGRPFIALEGKTYNEIAKSTSRQARKFVEIFHNYELSIVLLSENSAPEEFNLQFTRLNLGTLIQSGEKLHAMIGDLRNECFDEGRLGSNTFLRRTGIPTRRYAAEQVTAQILAQIFSLADNHDYTRTRHFDLQRLFKQHFDLTKERRKLIGKLSSLLELLDDAFSSPAILRNRAIVVSTVLLAWESKVDTTEEAARFAEFVEQFQEKLLEQVRKGLDVDSEFRYLVEFQKHLTQASGERPAVTRRAELMASEYAEWQRSGRLSGDMA